MTHLILFDFSFWKANNFPSTVLFLFVNIFVKWLGKKNPKTTLQGGIFFTACGRMKIAFRLCSSNASMAPDIVETTPYFHSVPRIIFSPTVRKTTHNTFFWTIFFYEHDASISMWGSLRHKMWIWFLHFLLVIFQVQGASCVIPTCNMAFFF